MTFSVLWYLRIDMTIYTLKKAHCFPPNISAYLGIDGINVIRLL